MLGLHPNLLLRDAYLNTKLQINIEIHTIRNDKKAERRNENVRCLANRDAV